MKVILYLWSVFLTSNESGQIVLAPDYQTRWNQYADAIRPYIDNVYAFYPVDEPNVYLANPQQDMETIASTIKATFPSAKLAVIYNSPGVFDLYNHTPGRSMPEGYDWIGFDNYQDAPCCYPVYSTVQFLGMLRSSLKSGQTMFLVPDAFRWNPPAASPSWAEQIALVYRASHYYQLALPDPSVTGLTVFVWQDLPSDGSPLSGFYGTQSMPLVQEKYHSIGACMRH